ncbi:hypothetical protein PMI09_05386 [Rhizobium sp. CF122]|nr:hypothetical protein PMI09_05386 [Rhizobium sp. CF122]
MLDNCLACYQECLSTAMIHCLEMGGEHTEPDHFRLMIARTSLLKTPLFAVSG